MTWYSITPTGTITLGNLTPVGQNSGLVGCRWPPNGNQLAAALNLPKTTQMWGPFWLHEKNLYLPVPQGVYTHRLPSTQNTRVLDLYRMYWQEKWQLHHQTTPDIEIEQLGGKYLIKSQDFRQLWEQGFLNQVEVQPLPWQTLTLSHNRREDFQVVEEGGLYAEKTILMASKWSIVIKVIGKGEPQKYGTLGAGATPIVTVPLENLETESWEFLGAEIPDADGAVLLTSALWSNGRTKTSHPYPDQHEPLAYLAQQGEPWQTWKTVSHKLTPERKLTPGEWLTPAGAIYRWHKAPITKSGPLLDPFNRHVWGYGHLWLFKENLI